jgi:hypothetical protein
MEPNAGQNFGPVPSSDDPNVSNYWCKAPGSVNKPPTATCTWQFAPTNNGVGMALVQHQQMPTLCGGGGRTKTCHDAHGKPQVCGLAFDSSKGLDPKVKLSPLYQECGNNSDRGGTWSAIQICTAIAYDNKNLLTDQVSQQFIDSLNCGTGAGSAGNAQLFQCIGSDPKMPPKSCYDPTADASCCGCPNWPATYKPNTTSQTGNAEVPNACYQTNPKWTSVSGAWLPYIKTACPAAYSYQYDDVTATFTCSTPNTTINATNYTITFCPDHRTAIVLQ